MNVSFTLILILLFAPCAPLCALILASQAKMKKRLPLLVPLSDMDRINPEAEDVLARCRKSIYIWGSLLFLLSFCAFFFPGFSVALTYLLLLLLAGILLPFLAFAGGHRELYEWKRSRSEEPLPDRYPLGQFYYDPALKKLTVPDPNGMGTLLNIARPFSKWLMVLCLLPLLLSPLAGFYTVAEEYTPLSLTVTEESLEAKQLFTRCSIDRESIREAELLDSLPALKKSSGSNYASLYKGRFRFLDGSQVAVLLDPTLSCFLLLKTTEGQYLLSGETDEETQLLYSVCLEQLTQG